MTTVKVKFRPSTVEDRPGTIVYLVTHRRIDNHQLQSVPVRMG